MQEIESGLASKNMDESTIWYGCIEEPDWPMPPDIPLDASKEMNHKGKDSNAIGYQSSSLSIAGETRNNVAPKTSSHG